MLFCKREKEKQTVGGRVYFVSIRLKSFFLDTFQDTADDPMRENLLLVNSLEFFHWTISTMFWKQSRKDSSNRIETICTWIYSVFTFRPDFSLSISRWLFYLVRRAGSSRGDGVPSAMCSRGRPRFSIEGAKTARDLFSPAMLGWYRRCRPFPARRNVF